MWLLERDGVAVGHACAGACGLPHPEAKPEDGELKRLYVLREAHNGGWGSRLFETVLDWLEKDGPRTLWIGVWSENLRRAALLRTLRFRARAANTNSRWATRWTTNSSCVASPPPDGGCLR